MINSLKPFYYNNNNNIELQYINLNEDKLANDNLIFLILIIVMILAIIKHFI